MDFDLKEILFSFLHRMISYVVFAVLIWYRGFTYGFLIWSALLVANQFISFKQPNLLLVMSIIIIARLFYQMIFDGQDDFDEEYQEYEEEN